MQVAMKTLRAATAAGKEKKKKHAKNAENVGAAFVSYVVETLGGYANDT